MTGRVVCIVCKLSPCACKYIKELLEGKHGVAVARAAKTQLKSPHPHRGGCPCPACWSARAADWEAWVIEMNKKGEL